LGHQRPRSGGSGGPRAIKGGVQPRLASGAARREKTLDVWLDGEHLHFDGTLYDTYGEPDGMTVIHEVTATGTIAIPGLEIKEIQIAAPKLPYGDCRLTLGRVDQVVGLSIGPGFAREIQRRLGGSVGCSHLTTLVLELAAAGVLYWFIQIRKHLPYSIENRESGRWGAVALSLNPAFVGVCHGWAEGGVMVARAEEALASATATGIPLLGHSPAMGQESLPTSLGKAAEAT
jgi:hypothetical protein